jgi:hypothetical protein
MEVKERVAFFADVVETSRTIYPISCFLYCEDYSNGWAGLVTRDARQTGEAQFSHRYHKSLSPLANQQLYKSAWN